MSLLAAICGAAHTLAGTSSVCAPDPSLASEIQSLKQTTIMTRVLWSVKARRALAKADEQNSPRLLGLAHTKLKRARAPLRIAIENRNSQDVSPSRHVPAAGAAPGGLARSGRSCDVCARQRLRTSRALVFSTPHTPACPHQLLTQGSASRNYAAQVRDRVACEEREQAACSPKSLARNTQPPPSLTHTRARLLPSATSGAPQRG